VTGFFSKILFLVNRKKERTLDQASSSAQQVSVTSCDVQIAVYDSIYNPPHVLYITSHDFHDLTHTLANETYAFASSKGGQIPYVSIKEIIENLIHAGFKDVVISIFPDGNTIRIADRGPGIPDKQKVFLPGFSTSTTETRKYIKGVGSGLSVAREALNYFAGQLCIEDNIDTGSVITLHIPKYNSDSVSDFHELENKPPCFNTPPLLQTQKQPPFQKDLDYIKLNLTSRQKKIMLFIAEINETGPSNIAKELNMSLSTAYRELVYLEELHLVAGLHSGKRQLTKYGLSYITYFFKQQ
jgi:hypothetical protein